MRHCETCTCDCTCGHGGEHDPSNAACELTRRDAALAEVDVVLDEWSQRE